MFSRKLQSMKKLIFIIICLCVCELCYSQEPQRIFHDLEKGIAYDSTTIDYTLKQIIPTDARTTFTLCKMEELRENVSILLRLHQYYGDYRILDSDLLAHVENGVITTVNGSYYSSVDNVENVPLLSESEILQIAESEVFGQTTDYDFQHKTEKVIAKNSFDSEDKNLYYASMVSVSDRKNLETSVDVIIDEQSGKILEELSRVIYAKGTANTRYNGTQTIGTTYEDSRYVLRDFTRGNGIFTRNLNQSNNISKLTDFTDADNNWTTAEYHNSNKDDGALDVHWAAMKTYDYFYTMFQRYSYDNAGAPITCYVHYGTNYENSFWESSLRLFCFGDGYTNNDIMTSLDIVAHEIGHAVCTYSANLKYAGESGAINEGLSDIWGTCVEDYFTNNKQPWLCGEDVDIRSDHSALRSMSNPNLEGQSDTYGGLYWYETEGCTPSKKNDFCGVHTNSGVLNYWFYLLCEGGSGTNDLNKSYSVNGIGIANAAKIVYRAETEYLSATSNFADMRACTLKAAEDLFPNNPSYGNSVADAWYAVGVEKNPPYALINKKTDDFPIAEDSTCDDKWFTLEGKTLLLSLPTNNNVVAIYNTEGQKVMQRKIGKSAKMDLSALPKGVYAVIINKNEQSCKISTY